MLDHPHPTLHCAVGTSSLGELLIACAADGVCWLALGEHRDALWRDLHTRWPDARVVDAAPRASAWLAQVVDFLDDPRVPPEVPVVPDGTPFQQRVWAALRTLPPGVTTTYTALALQLGDAKAVRAVATACAANPVAILIPCHRVVRGDGTFAGYRWGVDRKRALLLREARAHPAPALLLG